MFTLLVSPPPRVQELFQSYTPGQPTGSMIVNPHAISPHQKGKVFSPQTYDLYCDRFAPRAIGYAGAKMSSTFAQGDMGGSYCGSPPRSRDKFIAGWFDHHQPKPRMSHGKSPVNDRVFLRGDPWESH